MYREILGQHVQHFRDAAHINSLIHFLGSSHIKTPFRVAVTLGCIYYLNRLLNHFTINASFALRDWDWKKEIVLVTGGSNGLGELVVKKLAAKGIKVVAVDLRPPSSDDFPASAHFYQLDVTSPEQIHRIAQSIRRDVGNPTVLINNAGVASLKTILEEQDEEIRRTFDVNVVAHFFLIREFLPSMIEQNHGHIITIASLASFVTIASNVDYSCSKAAALSLHEGLTQELKYKYNTSKVSTSVVHPIWLRTSMFESAFKTRRFADALIKPNDVAEAIVAHVLKGKSGQLFFPWYHSIASGLRWFPAWFQERIRGSRSELL
ncbi:hypothetical protein BGZ63DRAFT_434781 [Mariannaea sp. PMI_226]|nr:hypothetical protein BGZ63DRAFT_434781 [Mariannaea sp. PMI_226]